MPYVFKYRRKCDDCTFQCPITRYRCEHVVAGANTQCKRQQYIGFSLCYQHLAIDAHLKIAPATNKEHGKGLFATNGTNNGDVVFKNAERIIKHSGEVLDKAELDDRNLPITMPLLRFIKFIVDDIFPGGRLPLVSSVEEHATRAGFAVSRVQPLQRHYAQTLDLWSAALESRRDEAIAIQSEEVYDQYMRYLTGCADLFRDGYTNVCQFTLDKSPRH